MNVTENPALFPGTIGARPQTAAAGAPDARADFQTFLSLLTAQLRNQDPLQPLDSTQFVAQLASFSTVEQIIGTNERLDALQASSLASEIAALGSWIGKEVAATDGSFRAPGGPVAFTVPAIPGAETISARVVDPSGAEVASFEVTPDANGTAYWNGRDADGAFVQDRALRIELSYAARDTVITQQPAAVFRTVVAIRGTTDGIALDLADGGTLDASGVSRLRDPRTASTPLPL